MKYDITLFKLQRNEISRDSTMGAISKYSAAYTRIRYHIHVANKLYNIHSCLYSYIRSILNSVCFRVTVDLGFSSKVAELPHGNQD